MTRPQIEEALASAVERLNADGDSWWSGTEIAPVAYWRLTTFSRRHKSRLPTDEHRVIDLVKGLQSHFEPDVPYTHPNDWKALATALVTAFQSQERACDMTNWMPPSKPRK